MKLRVPTKPGLKNQSYLVAGGLNDDCHFIEPTAQGPQKLESAAIRQMQVKQQRIIGDCAHRGIGGNKPLHPVDRMSGLPLMLLHR